MAESTPNLGLPFPVAGDSDNVPKDMKALAEALDALALTAGSAVGHTVGGGSLQLTEGLATGSGSYLLGQSGTGSPKSASGNFYANQVRLLPLLKSRFTLPGRTPKVNIRAALVNNGTAFGTTITVNLLPVTAASGAAGTLTLTLGSAVGSLSATFASGASKVEEKFIGPVTFPADGIYVLGAVIGGTLAANSGGIVSADLVVTL